VIRVLIADDHAVVRQGLRTFLDLQADIDVVGEAADGEEAVAVAAEHAPDVILLDLVMPRLDGIGALRRLSEVAPGARVIVLTSFGEDERLFTALRAGARTSGSHWSWAWRRRRSRPTCPTCWRSWD
jgi:DNA-binding NarL/FixJ family response regulator